MAATVLGTRICGIPATIRVHKCKHVKGSFSRNAPSDLDYAGYYDLDYEICDRHGYAAPWLEAKMTKDDRAEVEAFIIKELSA